MKTHKKRISVFNFLVMLFLSAGIIVFFVYNIISVNKLVFDNDVFRNDLNKTVSLNNTLQTEIQRMSSFDNIKNTAVYKLNLSFSNNLPKKIIVNKSDLN